MTSELVRDLYEKLKKTILNTRA